MCRVSYRILSFGRGGIPKFGVDVEVWSMLPQIFFLLIDALRLGVLVVSSKREVYTARLSFIWVVKEKRGRGGGVGVGTEFLTTLCGTIY